MPRFSVSKETGCCVLDPLESVDGGGGDAGEEGVAIVEAENGEKYINGRPCWSLETQRTPEQQKPSTMCERALQDQV